MFGQDILVLKQIKFAGSQFKEKIRLLKMKVEKQNLHLLIF
ncbi:hypothetical protein LEP1GSC059_4152 [Leptospira noguchii serovar Panama str. CZ214]|uniref:Uncharacterized protein n=1 Tax=Leptospira noguchii serovar Panama str. CZ214 TaxID=1001595 RepID=T0FAK5_9LEPT|nr:hypothetical protein LEP1GSC059_4152 [Leptospira noguchii serovar Panama str. CZ214]